MDNRLEQSRIPIWQGTIPWNHGGSKLADMEVHPEYGQDDFFIHHPGVFAARESYVEDMSGNDTMAYRAEIQHGPARDTYTDEPFLVPWVVPGSRRAVLVCPGGAYLLKSMDNEGDDVAAFLNDAGISCFVLWYRSYPYRAPVMFRDCQRAIRYLRHHAADWGIDPGRISLLGFSAGGNLAATTVSLWGGQAMDHPGYEADDVDRESDAVESLGLVYPAVSFEEAQVFLQCIESREVLRDPAARMRLARQYTLRHHVRPDHPPTFLCAAMDDSLIPPRHLADYAAALAEKSVSCALHLFPEGGHGFGGCNPLRHPELEPGVLAAVGRWRELYVDWLGRQGQERSYPSSSAATAPAPNDPPQGFNPYLPLWEYVPDAEPRVFGDRVYAYGSHDRFNGHAYCLGDYVCWSAPVDNLAAWRYEGVIYRAEDVEDNADRDSCLYAPDVVQGPDGRYYLYYVDSKRSIVSVAVCSQPAGRYRFLGYVRDWKGGVLGARPGDEAQFDPGVLVEDDAVYLYTGFCAIGDTSRHGAMVTILEPDMVTMRTEPAFVIPSQPYAAGTSFEGHEFFEAPSIRKHNGLYHLIYSSVAMHELCHATSPYPDRGFTWRGVIVSNADHGISAGKPADKPMYYGANNHGSIVDIKGTWHVFYHRHTNGHQYSRQGCIEPIRILPDGAIPQVGMTSCGPNGGPLRGSGEYPAGIACHLFCTDESLYTDCTSAWMDHQYPKITQEGGDCPVPEQARAHGSFIANMKEGACAGYRWFDFRGLKGLGIRVRGYCLGHFEVRTSWDGECLATIPVHFSNSWQDYRTDLAIPDGVQGLYLTYRGSGAAQLAGFVLEL